MVIRTARALVITVIALTLAGFLYIFTENPQIAPVRNSSNRAERARIEQYQIYSALLEHYVTNKTKLLIIWSSTSEDLSEEVREDDLTEILRSMVSQVTIDDYAYQNRESKSLDDLLAVSVNYRLIGPEDVRVPSGNGFDWWDTFHKRNPQASGVITLSRIGYNEDLNQALVYVEYYCGFLCATGKYFSLGRKDGVWTIIHEYMRWIS